MPGLHWTPEELAEYKRRAKGGKPLPAEPVLPQAPKPRMNGTESRYAESLTSMGLSWKFESMKLRLADRTWYTPDFLVISPAGDMGFHEVKGGFIREDAWIKLKIAREQFPEFGFIAMQWDKGQWRRLL